jgi:hypothetical protein
MMGVADPCLIMTVPILSNNLYKSIDDMIHNLQVGPQYSFPIPLNRFGIDLQDPFEKPELKEEAKEGKPGQEYILKIH